MAIDPPCTSPVYEDELMCITNTTQAWELQVSQASEHLVFIESKRAFTIEGALPRGFWKESPTRIFRMSLTTGPDSTDRWLSEADVGQLGFSAPIEIAAGQIFALRFAHSGEGLLSMRRLSPVSEALMVYIGPLYIQQQFKVRIRNVDDDSSIVREIIFGAD